MNAQTRLLVTKILRESFVAPIGVGFKATSPMPSGGERKSLSKGSGGYDLEGLVTYEPGDDPRDIDWRSTAQLGGGELFIAQFMEPRDVKVFVLVDVSKSMDFGTHRVTKKHLACELTSSLINSCDESGDRVGVIVYDHSSVLALHKANTPKVVLVPGLVSVLEANSRPGSGSKLSKGDGSGLSEALLKLPAGRNVVYIISDFFNLTEADKASLKRASVANQITCINVSDVRERSLPKVFGYISMFDIASHHTLTIWSNDSNRKLFENNFRNHIDSLKASMKDLKIPLFEFVTDEGKTGRKKFMRMLISPNHKI